MTLESSELEFASRYEAFAAQGQLYSQREGSPLLEFASGGRVLYLFDRSGPYRGRPGPARVVVHGVLDRRGDGPRVLTPDELGRAREALTVVGVSEVEGVGKLLAVSRRVWVVHARLPLVLGAFEELPGAEVGEWVSFRTLPPLHGFLL
ncbi:hypothetical protein DAETH_02340 [Deinococcus aetherius]|uniref:Uncharacterized protein n=1 Tax=Deinococcus aetherius TaxID=200252 RepID=A0ABN6RA88_9DEIO|nr:hypothetical protein [Deinococcus aetherius]BDP40265.1 hypothetical protein DAETH_02340 [Deinococcus aetherius]